MVESTSKDGGSNLRLWPLMGIMQEEVQGCLYRIQE
jgi:hypothetical protein